MAPFVLWLLGIAVAMVGVGLTLFFQGQALTQPKRSEAVGRKAIKTGWIWITLGIVYGIIAIINGLGLI